MHSVTQGRQRPPTGSLRAAWSGARQAPPALAWLVGLLFGLAAWGAYDGGTALLTSTAFCVSCHEMQTAADQYRHAIHFSNRSGVRAECADCHVPRPFVPRILHMIGATNDLIGHITGVIDTPAKFEAQRGALAKRVWAEMAGNLSSGCRNCHNFAAMDFAKQRPEASQAMHVAMAPTASCIDCHKGITHQLPIVVTPVPVVSGPAIASPILAGQSGFIGIATATLSAKPGEAPIATLFVSAPVTVTAIDANGVHVTSRLWMKADAQQAGPLYGAPDGFEKGRLFAANSARRGAAVNNWVPMTLDGVVAPGALAATLDQAWLAAETTYEFTCAACHVLHPANAYTPAKWDAEMVVMGPNAHLPPDDAMVLLKWLQTESQAAQHDAGQHDPSQSSK